MINSRQLRDYCKALEIASDSLTQLKEFRLAHTVEAVRKGLSAEAAYQTHFGRNATELVLYRTQLKAHNAQHHVNTGWEANRERELTAASEAAVKSGKKEDLDLLRKVIEKYNPPHPRS